MEPDHDGINRCPWAAADSLYVEYHDSEWGQGTIEDRMLFEKLCLEGFQAGLSWLTILRKRPAFRRAFADFEPVKVASFGESDVARLLSDAGIVRHRGKIRSAINNARRALEMIEEHGSLARFFWRYADLGNSPPDIPPSSTPVSTVLASELKTLGWTFVGPTTVYAFMQAMGLVNDHLAQCDIRDAAQRNRVRVARRLGTPG